MASKKPFVIGRLVVGVVLFIVTIFPIVFSGCGPSGKSFDEHKKWAEEQRKKQSAETVGTITDYKESHTGKSYYYYVTYEFEVAGKKYTDTTAVSDGHPVKYPKGGQGKVCYDPAAPENAFYTRKEDNYKCGQ